MGLAWVACEQAGQRGMLSADTLQDECVSCVLPGAVELRNEVSRAFGLELPGTLVYDYPTPSAIAAFLSARVDPAATTRQQMAGR